MGSKRLDARTGPGKRKRLLRLRGPSRYEVSLVWRLSSRTFRLIATNIFRRNMTMFPTASDAASWTGICPGNNDSAGKRRTGRIPKGNVHLKTALVEAANAAARAKGTYLRDKFYRVKARRGCKGRR